MKIVIRAGGSGTKLWPVSRQRRPKQFLPLLGKRTLLEEKLREVRPLVRRWDDLYLSVSLPFVRLARRLAPKIPPSNIIAEPVGRNTGPAIALESGLIQAATRGKDDPVIASVTVDDVFRRSGAFRAALRAAERFLHRHPLWSVALAATTPLPDVALSYIERGSTIESIAGQSFTRSKRWVEKPTPRLLAGLLRRPNVFAHTGLYVWKASTVFAHFERYRPEIFRRVRTIAASWGTRSYSSTLAKHYAAMPAMSVEEAITRRVRHLAIAAADFGWSDTGKWHLVQHLLGGNGNVTRGTVVSVDDEGSLIYAPAGKVIGTVGLRDMIVVDTGDALLVCPKNRSTDVKLLIERLRDRGLTNIL